MHVRDRKTSIMLHSDPLTYYLLVTGQIKKAMKLTKYLSKLNNQRSFSSLEPTAIAVSHRQVHLTTVTPQLGRMNRQPLG